MHKHGKIAMCRFQRHGLEIQARGPGTAHMRVKLHAHAFADSLGAPTAHEVLSPEPSYRGSRCDEPGKIRSFLTGNEYQLTDGYESGGAGLISSVEDYSLFADALANGGVGASGAQILKPETIDLMRKEQLSACTVDPTFECAAGPGYGYALGVRTLIDRSQGQRSPLGEFGWDGAVGSYLMVDVENEIAIVYMQHVGAWTQIRKHPFHAPMRDGAYEAFGL